MTRCEMCGNNSELLPVEIESVEMQVCSKCARYGTPKKKNSTPQFYFKKNKTNGQPEYTINPNYATLIRGARESRNLSQEDFAKLLNERVSIVQKWEQGSIRPNLDVAKELERKLNLRLVEKIDSEEKEISKTSKNKHSEELTLGDFIKIRKRGNKNI